MSIFNVFGSSPDTSNNQNDSQKNSHIIQGASELNYDPTDGSQIRGSIQEMGGMDRLSIMLHPMASLYVRSESQLLLNNTLTMSPLGKVEPNKLHESFSTGTFMVNKISVLSNVLGSDMSNNRINSSSSNGSASPSSSTQPTGILGTITSVFSSKKKTGGRNNDYLSDSDSGSDSDSEMNSDSEDMEDMSEKIPMESNLSIFSIIPGKIQALVLNINDEWCLHHRAFLACSENLTIETAVSFKLGIQGNGTHVTKVRNQSNRPGLLWMISYGGIMDQSLEFNQFVVHSGLFLATKSANYDKAHIRYMGNLFEGISGGEMIMMDFSKTEPAPGDKLYIQTGNIDEYIHFMTKSIPKNENSRIGNDMGFKKEVPPPSTVETPFPVTTPTDMGSPMKSLTEGPVQVQPPPQKPQKGGESRKRTTRRKRIR